MVKTSCVLRVDRTSVVHQSIDRWLFYVPWHVSAGCVIVGCIMGFFFFRMSCHVLLFAWISWWEYNSMSSLQSDICFSFQRRFVIFSTLFCLWLLALMCSYFFICLNEEKMEMIYLYLFLGFFLNKQIYMYGFF